MALTAPTPERAGRLRGAVTELKHASAVPCIQPATPQQQQAPALGPPGAQGAALILAVERGQIYRTPLPGAACCRQEQAALFSAGARQADSPHGRHCIEIQQPRKLRRVRAMRQPQPRQSLRACRPVPREGRAPGTEAWARQCVQVTEWAEEFRARPATAAGPATPTHSPSTHTHRAPAACALCRCPRYLRLARYLCSACAARAELSSSPPRGAAAWRAAAPPAPARRQTRTAASPASELQ